MSFVRNRVRESLFELGGVRGHSEGSLAGRVIAYESTVERLRRGCVRDLVRLVCVPKKESILATSPRYV